MWKRSLSTAGKAKKVSLVFFLRKHGSVGLGITDYAMPQMAGLELPMPSKSSGRTFQSS